jgi:hypothetical protein
VIAASMHNVHGMNAKVRDDRMANSAYDLCAMNDQKGYVTRTLTIVLPEPEWQALRSAEPDAIGWLHDRIKERLSTSDVTGLEQMTAVAEERWSGRDEY